MNVLLICPVVALLVTVAPVAIGKTAACTISQAGQAEASLDNLRSWEDAIQYFKQYEPCLDGGVSEGYTVFLARKLAEDHGVSRLLESTKRQRWFRPLVAKRMQSEVIPLDTTESILKGLRFQCLPEAKSFCQDLYRRVKNSCPACSPDL